MPRQTLSLDVKWGLPGLLSECGQSRREALYWGSAQASQFAPCAPSSVNKASTEFPASTLTESTWCQQKPGSSEARTGFLGLTTRHQEPCPLPQPRSKKQQNLLESHPLLPHSLPLCFYQLKRKIKYVPGTRKAAEQTQTRNA